MGQHQSEALQWTINWGRTVVGLRLAGALATIWLDRNFALEGQQWFETLLGATGGLLADEVQGERARGRRRWSPACGATSIRAMAWGQGALDLYRALGSEEGIAWSLTTVALGADGAGPP